MAPLPKNLSRIRDIIVRANLVDELQLRSASAHFQQWGGRFAHSLVELGFVDEEVLTEALGVGLGMRVVHLGTVPKDANALSKVDVAFCEEHAVYPVLYRDRVLTLAMADPTQVEVIEVLQPNVPGRIVPVLASESEILAVISRNYRGKTLPSGGQNRVRKAMTQEFRFTAHGAGEIIDFDAPKPSPAKAPRTSPAPARTTSGGSRMIEEEFSPDALTPVELERVRIARETQEKAGQILRALQQLLAEKGYLPK